MSSACRSSRRPTGSFRARRSRRRLRRGVARPAAWNGVAILARGAEPVLTRDALPGDADDTQSRYIEAAVSGVLVASLYAPNGNPQPGPKFDYKLAWHERLNAHAERAARDRRAGGAGRRLQRRAGAARHLSDQVLRRQRAGAAGKPRTPSGGCSSRAGPTRCASSIPDETVYTFWDYRRNRWPRNAGLRLDHILLSQEAGARSSGRRRRPRGARPATTPATTRRCGSRSTYRNGHAPGPRRRRDTSGYC